MDTARVWAISVLGYNFWVHMLRAMVSPDKEDQAELFREYFREDRIAPLTPEEHADLARFEGCVACGLCPSRCRVRELSAGRFHGPAHLAATTSRSHPDFIHDLDSMLLCAACGQCEPICPEWVPVSKMAPAMRSMIWRTTPESLPEAYQEAVRNLCEHGSVYGAEPELDLPADDDADVAVVLGPALRRDPARAGRLFEVLAKVGIKGSAVKEGSLGGVAAAMGLAPDDGWVDELAAHEAKEIVVADPEAWLSLRDDERLAGKEVRFALEALADQAGTALAEGLPGPVAVHDSYPLARGSSRWRLTREVLEAGGAKLVEMDDAGEDSPPLGWEGGLDLVDPDLAKLLLRARIQDARAAGAEAMVTATPADLYLCEQSGAADDFPVLYLIDLIHRALG